LQKATKEVARELDFECAEEVVKLGFTNSPSRQLQKSFKRAAANSPKTNSRMTKYLNIQSASKSRGKVDEDLSIKEAHMRSIKRNRTAESKMKSKCTFPRVSQTQNLSSKISFCLAQREKKASTKTFIKYNKGI
jgi:hypothetical protein